MSARRLAPALRRYLGSWRTLVPEPWRQGPLTDLLEENDTVGCYIPPAQVGPLAAAIRAGELPQEALDAAFSHGRLEIFLRALDDAAAQGRGLLEAANVAQPDPFGGWRECLTRADHCHEEGIVLYAEAAEAQLAAAKDFPSK